MKKTLYPKTKRIGEQKIIITEKLDGSNIGFFKVNDELLIAQRNNIYFLNEIIGCNKDDLYGGLSEWLNKHSDELKASLYDNSGFFAEWISMGKLKYDFENRVQMFAKANINSDLEAYNIYYDRKLFIYPFKDQIIPSFISVVPKVKELKEVSIDVLNKEYDEYVKKVGRNVEGFIVIYNDESIKKYVRMKNGELENHEW